MLLAVVVVEDLFKFDKVRLAVSSKPKFVVQRTAVFLNDYGENDPRPTSQTESRPRPLLLRVIKLLSKSRWRLEPSPARSHDLLTGKYIPPEHAGGSANSRTISWHLMPPPLHEVQAIQ